MSNNLWEALSVTKRCHKAFNMVTFSLKFGWFWQLSTSLCKNEWNKTRQKCHFYQHFFHLKHTAKHVVSKTTLAISATFTKIYLLSNGTGSWLHRYGFEQGSMRPPGSNPEGAAFVFAGANPPTPSFSAYFVLIVISKCFCLCLLCLQKEPKYH